MTRDALRRYLRNLLPRMPALITLAIGLANAGAAPRLVHPAADGAMVPLAELICEAKPTGGKAPKQWWCI